MERRPEKGLLGGMLGWPGPAWAEIANETQPFAVESGWRNIGAIRHTFTHFHLDLEVAISTNIIEVPDALLALNENEFRASDLPTVMRKAYDLAFEAMRKM
jgi:A/G-specific adenine glycosylase